jgi:hypothetical protein
MIKVRKQCEYNFYEYAAAVLLAKHAGKVDSPCTTLDEIASVSPDCIESAHSADYLLAMGSVNKRYANQWIQRFNLELAKHPFPDIQKVYLCGKYELPDIKVLNQHLHRADKKGDIYIQTTKEFVAFSIKQTTSCTKTNWSVERMIPGDLKRTRLQYLNESGFTTFQKSERTQVNRLFYGENPYFTLLRTQIETHRPTLLNEFKHSLYGFGLPYPLYEFDSKSLKCLNGTPITHMSMEEYHAHYWTKKGNKKSTAKLFYRLKMNEDTYRIEVRWKGNVFVSPQFHTHME